MPSPFPGMDPFIEGQKWRNFHHSVISQIRDDLQSRLRPRYFVDIEENVYLAREDGDLHKVVVPDLYVTKHEGWLDSIDRTVAVATEPAVLTLPEIESQVEAFLLIRAAGNDEVVTVIEVLSPTNKRTKDGRTEYLKKRYEILHSDANLVEIDLLRGGQRLPTVERLPTADYYAFITRVEKRPKVEVYGWPLEKRIPTIPIPLAEGDPDALLDLQSVVDATYDRAGFDFILKYDRPLDPPLSESQQRWADDLLRAAK